MTTDVLFYVQHLLGVGHVKRAAALCRGFERAGLRVTVVLGGPPVDLADFGDAEIVQLPTAWAADPDFSAILKEDGNPIDDTWRAGRRDRLLALYERTRPNVILIELFPFGRRQFRFELLPLLEAARGQARVACSVRDVLVAKDKPERNREVADTVDRYFERVFVHGDPTVVSFEATFPETKRIRDRIAYTGYVCELEVGGSDGLKAPGEIVVSTGGGAVGENLMRTALAARRAGYLVEYPWRMLAGGNLDPAVFDGLRDQAPEGVIVEWARPDFRYLLDGAALSISQGGYNTVMDVLAADCPALVVPFADGGESEQAYRARKFERRGLLHVLDEATMTPERLGQSAEAAIAAPPAAHDFDLNGVETTARLVAAMVGDGEGP